MNLRDEVAERLIASVEHGWSTDETRPLSGVMITSDDWSASTQAAVNSIMAAVNGVFEGLLRVAEAVDELRDTLDVDSGPD